METRLLSGIFRQLFRDCPYRQIGQTTPPLQHHLNGLRSPSIAALDRGRRQQRRHLKVPKLPTKESMIDRESWHPVSRQPPADFTEVFKKAPLETARSLARRRERPRMCKMLARDYIDDCLYNPHYGYFSKEAVIFHTPEPFRFSSMRNEFEFDRELTNRYAEFEDALDAEEPSDIRQLWHTPTELFKPYYGEAIARYLYENYLDWYPEYDLVIYEMGAGNGTLMVNVLDFLRSNYPDVYVRARFKIIEISPRLADRQRRAAEASGHGKHVEIVNTSFFNFDHLVSSPCFFLALEVLDNFAHDMVRYNVETQEALQGYVLLDQAGDFHEFYTKELDSETARFLDLRSSVYDPASDPFYKRLITRSFGNPGGSLTFGTAFDKIKRSLFKTEQKLTAPEYLPIRMMQFFEILNRRFPHHRLVMSDFHYLPDTIEGVNAPVVQTRYKRTTVPVSTLYVQQGYFDILFPTNFQMAKMMYELVCGKFSRVMTHEDFMKQWAELSDTTTRNGDNPMLNWYANASVMCTV